MSLPQRVASTQSNRPRRRLESPLVAFEPAARSRRPPNGQTNNAAETRSSLALCCGPVSGNSGIALSAPKRHLPGFPVCAAKQTQGVYEERRAIWLILESRQEQG